MLEACQQRRIGQYIIGMHEKHDIAGVRLSEKPLDREALRVPPSRLEPECGWIHAKTGRCLRRWDCRVLQVAQEHLHAARFCPTNVVVGLVWRIVMEAVLCLAGAMLGNRREDRKSV